MAYVSTTEEMNRQNNTSFIQPLADRMRPKKLNDFCGQQHILGKDKPLQLAIETDKLHSMILWGTPGSGKTTLARMIAQYADAHFMGLSAVLAGVKDVRAAVAEAQQTLENKQQRTVLFIDEVHRFNKAQQDAFLPYIEDGTFIFIGATTENPSFELNNALLSRARVYVLKPLEPDDIRRILDRAITDEQYGLGQQRIDIAASLLDRLAGAADGDARRAPNFLEIATELAEVKDQCKLITGQLIDDVLSSGSIRRFDKGGEAFYDQISALHKSVRGSAPDAALYWLSRMLDGGCDPRYIARRLVRMASEDIGNADPRCLRLALDAWEVQERLGSPEGELALAQTVAYLACAPKSNAIYKAYGAALADAKNHGSLDVPLKLRNAPTALMKKLDYGKTYRYAHDEPDAYVAGESYFPESLGERKYYHPVQRGLEKKIAEKLAYLKQLDKSCGSR